MAAHVLDGHEPQHVGQRPHRPAGGAHAPSELLLGIRCHRRDRPRPVAHELVDQVVDRHIIAAFHLTAVVVVDGDRRITRPGCLLVGGSRQLEDARVRPLHRRDVREQLAPVPTAFVHARRQVETIEPADDLVARCLQRGQQLGLRPHRPHPTGTGGQSVMTRSQWSWMPSRRLALKLASYARR